MLIKLPLVKSDQMEVHTGLIGVDTESRQHFRAEEPAAATTTLLSYRSFVTDESMTCKIRPRSSDQCVIWESLHSKSHSKSSLF